MRLFEIAMAGDTLYKAQSAEWEAGAEDTYSYEKRINELKHNIQAWKKTRFQTPYDQMMIEKMEDELRELEEIGEIPFTFYAAKDRDGAEYFKSQFSDGKVGEVKIYAKKLATVDDLRAVGFPEKRTVSHLTPMMIHKLKKAGFDGATGHIDNVGGDEVVVFSPEQVKRV